MTKVAVKCFLDRLFMGWLYSQKNLQQRNRKQEGYYREDDIPNSCAPPRLQSFRQIEENVQHNAYRQRDGNDFCHNVQNFWQIMRYTFTPLKSSSICVSNRHSIYSFTSGW